MAITNFDPESASEEGSHLSLLTGEAATEHVIAPPTPLEVAEAALEHWDGVREGHLQGMLAAEVEVEYWGQIVDTQKQLIKDISLHSPGF